MCGSAARRFVDMSLSSSSWRWYIGNDPAACHESSSVGANILLDMVRPTTPTLLLRESRPAIDNMVMNKGVVMNNGLWLVGRLVGRFVVLSFDLMCSQNR